jgi:F0F1-type ATP synthase assembly protein I
MWGVGQGAKQPNRAPGKLNLPFAKIAKYLAIGLEIPSTIIGALVLGYLMDLQFGTSPWFAVVLSVLGFVGAVARLMQYLKRFGDGRHES